MKKVFLITILIFISVASIAQSNHNYEYHQLMLPKENGRIIYKEVVDAPNRTQDQLYTSARLWFLDSFKSSKDVIQYEERESGIIAGNGNTSLYISTMVGAVENKLFFSVRIEVKDEKFRYQISDLFIQHDLNSPKMPVERWLSAESMYKKNGKPKELYFQWYDQYEAEIIAIEESIVKTLKNPSSKQSTDW
jgi:hypothetical protein